MLDVLVFTPELLGFLFFIAVLAGFIDTLAGGGGLITLPALMMTGMPPLSALATNKLQGSVGTATATITLLRKKRLVFSELKLLMLAAFVGSVGGTVIVQFIDTSVLSFIIPSVLVFIVIYFVLAPLPQQTSEPRMTTPVYCSTAVPVIGVYDGMFGPGTGSFFGVAGVSLRGLALREATMQAKALNFSTNIASLIVFLFGGYIVWLVGGIMMLGQGIGAYLGTHYLIKINPRYLRWLVVVVCLVMLAKYFQRYIF